MRNLRKAALVAAMVGTLGMFGAGVASATGTYGDGDSSPVFCNQEARIGDEVEQNGLVNVALLDSPLNLLSGTNSAESSQSAISQQCSGGDSFSGQGQEGFGLAAGEAGGGLLNGLLGGL